MWKLFSYVYMCMFIVYLVTAVIRWRLDKKLADLRGFDYDRKKDIVTIGKVRMSGNILRFLADEANSGDTFQVIERADGLLNITVTKSEEHEHVKKIVDDTLGKWGRL